MPAFVSISPVSCSDEPEDSSRAVSLLKRGIEVIGLDASPLAPGLLIPGIIPRVTASADSPGYPAELLGLCSELRPADLFSTVEHELPALTRMRHDLAGLGVRTWLPGLDGARAFLDKAGRDQPQRAALPARDQGRRRRQRR